jgi:hypothetical protein
MKVKITMVTVAAVDNISMTDANKRTNKCNCVAGAAVDGREH